VFCLELEEKVFYPKIEKSVCSLELGKTKRPVYCCDRSDEDNSALYCAWESSDCPCLMLGRDLPYNCAGDISALYCYGDISALCCAGKNSVIL